MVPDKQAAASPCIKQCQLDTATKTYCVSCGRTIAQIIEAGKAAKATINLIAIDTD